MHGIHEHFDKVVFEIAIKKQFQIPTQMLSENGFKVNEDVTLSVAMKNEITEII